MNKHTKILVPEIPGEYTDRTRSGNLNIWNKGKPNEVSLMPPEQGLYAELIDGAWYWVSGCAKCNETNERWSYIVCDKHNVCIACGIHRSKLTDSPWGRAEGFICRPCHEREHEEEKQAAIAKAQAEGHDEYDCSDTDEIICPVCASVNSSDDIHESREGMKCDTCDAIFDLEVEYSVTYTTTLSKKKEAA